MDAPDWLQPALGYLDLKMFDQTWETLDRLPPHQRDSFEALEVRVSCRLDEGRFEEALELCAQVKARFPEEHSGYIQGAFCLHELKRTTEAQDWLQSGPASLQMEAKYFYNLGCYDLALGKRESACAWLVQAFEMDPSYYDDALKDENFACIIDRLTEMKEANEEEDFT